MPPRERHSTTQHQLMVNCQRMADAAVRMQCRCCLQVFMTTDFYDHIKDLEADGDCRVRIEGTLASMPSFPRGSSANAMRPHNRTISSIRGAHMSRNQALRSSAN